MTRIFKILLLVVLMVVTAALAVINAGVIELNYFVGTAKLPLALVLIISFIAGALLALLFNLSSVISLRCKNDSLRKKSAINNQQLERLTHSVDVEK